MSRKRVLYLCADRGIPVGGTKGASIHVREFVDTLPRIGFEPVVAAARFEPEAVINPGWVTHKLPITSKPGFLDDDLDPDKQVLSEAKDYYRKEEVERTLASICEDEPFDLIYERYSLFSTAGCSFARSVGIPFVLEVNAPLVAEAGQYRRLSQLDLARSVERYLFTEADHIVSVSGPLKEYILGVAPNASVTVVPNGVTLERFENAGKGTWPDILGLPASDGMVIGFVGSIKPWHGVNLLIESLGRLRNGGGNARLCVVGSGDESYEQRLKDQCRALGLDGRVKFVGAVPYDEIPSVLKSMDVLVAPYPDLNDFYFSPLKVFEYMAAGRPIIASRIGQITDILIHEQTAILVAPGDCDALASALRRLQAEPELGRTLSEAALEEVRRHHTWRQRLQTIGGIFEACLSVTRSKVE